MISIKYNDRIKSARFQWEGMKIWKKNIKKISSNCLLSAAGAVAAVAAWSKLTKYVYIGSLLNACLLSQSSVLIENVCQ